MESRWAAGPFPDPHAPAGCEHWGGADRGRARPFSRLASVQGSAQLVPGAVDLTLDLAQRVAGFGGDLVVAEAEDLQRDDPVLTGAERGIADRLPCGEHLEPQHDRVDVIRRLVRVSAVVLERQCEAGALTAPRAP